jgi:hypothetical protein
MNKCDVCGENAIQKKIVRNYEYPTPMGLVTIEGASEFESCGSCDEVFIPGALIDHWNRLILKTLLQSQTRYTPHELEFIFSVLPFSQSEIAKATGKDRSTLTHYKTGKNPVDPLFEDTLQQMIEDYLAGNETTMNRLIERSQFVIGDENPRKLKVH